MHTRVQKFLCKIKKIKQRIVNEILHKYKSELETLLDNMPDYAFFKMADGRYRMCNRKMCSDVGISKESLIGKTVFEVFPVEIAEELNRDDEMVLAGSVDYIESEIEFVYNGIKHCKLIRKVRLVDSNGDTTGLVGVAIDVTEKKAMEKELLAAYDELEKRVVLRTHQLAQANEQLEYEIKVRKQALEEIGLIVSSIPSALVITDMNDIVTKWNEIATKTLLLSSSQCIGRAFTNLPIAWEWNKVIEARITSCELLQPVKVDDLWYERSDGSDGCMCLTLSPIQNGVGCKTGILLLGSDVTEYKLLEKQLAQASKLESIGQLAAGVAHEINTPIQYLSNTVSFLEDACSELVRLLDLATSMSQENINAGVNVVTERIEQYMTALEKSDYLFLCGELPGAFERAQDGIERIAAIVRAMRVFAHHGSSETVNVNLNELLDNTLVVAQHEWKNVAIIEKDYDSELEDVVCMPTNLSQAILNIIINAVHAIRDVGGSANAFGRIKISTKREKDNALIAISDSGDGVPLHVRDKIFDPFFTTKEVGKGTGQGLTIAYDIVVNMHGGTIECATSEGGGGNI